MEEKSNHSSSAPNFLLGLAGAVGGGLLGYFAFLWIVRQGFYPLALPGALLGLGCGLLVKRRSLMLAVLCGLLALPWGAFLEWRIRPFQADPGLLYFAAHLQDLQPITLLMIALGGVCAFWFALGRKRKPKDG